MWKKKSDPPPPKAIFDHVMTCRVCVCEYVCVRALVLLWQFLLLLGQKKTSKSHSESSWWITTWKEFLFERLRGFILEAIIFFHFSNFFQNNF